MPGSIVLILIVVLSIFYVIRSIFIRSKEAMTESSSLHHDKNLDVSTQQETTSDCGEESVVKKLNSLRGNVPIPDIANISLEELPQRLK